MSNPTSHAPFSASLSCADPVALGAASQPHVGLGAGNFVFRKLPNESFRILIDGTFLKDCAALNMDLKWSEPGPELSKRINGQISFFWNFANKPRSWPQESPGKIDLEGNRFWCIQLTMTGQHESVVSTNTIP